MLILIIWQNIAVYAYISPPVENLPQAEKTKIELLTIGQLDIKIQTSKPKGKSVITLKKKSVNQNPSPCKECCYRKASKVELIHLRTLGVGPGSFLCAGLACRMEYLSCLHYLNAIGSLNRKPSHIHQRSRTTTNRTFSPWNYQDRSEHSHASNTGESSGNVFHIADSAVIKSASTKTRLSTTCNHRRKAAAISYGIWFCLVSNATQLKQTELSSNGRLIFSMVLNLSFISNNRFGFSRLAIMVRRGILRHTSENVTGLAVTRSN